MGLAGPKKRAKLSHDPNNTAWSRNTESFGHKILSSQGWTPGDTLGAKDAAHSSHYTAGSNSHIRVLLKDDQLGLGAKLAGNNAETFGLSLFSGILGRLNGKSEVQLEKEDAAQRDVELALYTSRKGCYVNFVSAGFLVGDRIENAELLKKDEMRKKNISVPTPEPTNKAVEPESDSQGTKRKRAEAEAAVEEESSSSDSDSSASEDKEPATSKPSKSKKSKTSSERVKTKKSTKSKKDSAVEDNNDDSSAADKKKSKKSKKEKKTKSSDATSSEDDERAAKKARKAERAEKRAEKEERRKKKEAKRAAKSASAIPSTTTTPAGPVSGSATPQAMPFIGRHAVRQRYIAAKGRAHLDPQALKEVNNHAPRILVYCSAES